MNNEPETIKNLLSSWGQSQQLPNNNQTIKNTVLNNLPVNSSAISSPAKPKRWLLKFALAGLGLFCIILAGPVILGGSAKKNTQTSDSYSMDSGLRMSESPGMISQFANSIPGFQEEIDITDTRQFLKTDYGAVVRSRRTQETTDRIQTMIRGYDGRIDQSSSSNQTGSISFVIPANKLESFRSELAQLVGARFIAEQTNTQNLLSQKQNIEESWQTAQTNLTNLTTQRDELVIKEGQASKTIESRTAFYNGKISALQLELKNHPERRAQIEPQLNQVVKESDSVINQLVRERDTYATQINNLNTQIDLAQGNLDAIGKQDDQLMNSVATVRGNITISSMNFWQFIGFYLPQYWPLYIAGIAIVTALILRHRRPRWEV